MKNVLNTLKGAWRESKFLSVWGLVVVFIFLAWFSQGVYTKLGDTQFTVTECEVGEAK